jgi:hypothetical protein
MKYMLMLQGTQADYDAMTGSPSPGSPSWSKEDTQAMLDFMQKLNEDLAASGELVDGQGLTAPSEAAMVSADKDGRPVMSDGGYGVNQEVLAGYWVLDCKSLERATEIAARVHQCPVPEGTTNYPVIVRPVGEAPEVD